MLLFPPYIGHVQWYWDETTPAVQKEKKNKYGFLVTLLGFRCGFLVTLLGFRCDLVYPCFCSNDTPWELSVRFRGYQTDKNCNVQRLDRYHSYRTLLGSCNMDTESPKEEQAQDQSGAWGPGRISHNPSLPDPLYSCREGCSIPGVMILP